MGLDLLITLVTYVLLPLLMAFLDMVFCLFGFAQPSTWDAQLVCGTLLHTDKSFPLEY
jgi:hypothetical protein